MLRDPANAVNCRLQGETMIWTIRTKLQQTVEEWSADIEIDSSSTLEQLHFAIQDAVDFDNDHLFTFYVARTDRSRNRKFLDDGDGQLDDTTLNELFPLETRKSLFYWFDFGDDWIFQVTKTRKSPHDPQQGVVYPRVVAEEGMKPEQYPGFDE